MPGLLLSLRNPSCAAVPLCTTSAWPSRVATIATRQHARRPLQFNWRRRKASLKGIHTSRASSATDGDSADLLTVAKDSTAFRNVDSVLLKDLQAQGTVEGLPSGYQLAVEAAAPEACHVLLHSCFIKINGEGKSYLSLDVRQT